MNDVGMASQFTYSSLIKPSRTKFFTGAQVGLRKNKFCDYWLDKPIHLYRMWFLFVRLVVYCYCVSVRGWRSKVLVEPPQHKNVGSRKIGVD